MDLGFISSFGSATKALSSPIRHGPFEGVSAITAGGLCQKKTFTQKTGL